MNWTAVGIRIGVPLGRRSYDPTPWLSPPATPVAVDDKATLYLATGLLDERHRAVKPGDPTHARFLRDARWQDTWTEAEHAEWCGVVQNDWPKSTRPRSLDALAFSVALAVHELSSHRHDPAVPSPGMGYQPWLVDAERDLRQFVERFGSSLAALPSMPGLTSADFSLTALQKRKVLCRANEMLSASRTNIRTDEVRGDVRLPRVTTERDVFRPTFAEDGGFTVSSLTCAVDLPESRAPVSEAVVRAARMVVEEMIRERDNERERVQASPLPRRPSGRAVARPRRRARSLATD